MTTPRFIHLDEVDSTNNWLRTNASTLPHATVVTATTQTAGRGQRGNTWESQPGANLTFSMLLRPANFPAAKQFYLSEAIALGVALSLSRLLPSHQVRVKWPNDIYVGDKKICGILIENSIIGDCIGQSIAGIGINVNQQCFLSDAPNPVSIFQLTGHNYQLKPLLDDVVTNILTNLDTDPVSRHQDYIRSIYGSRPSLYRTPDGKIFEAEIHSIAPDGMLTLHHTADGTLKTYAFKEVARVLPCNKKINKKFP